MEGLEAGDKKILVVDPRVERNDPVVNLLTSNSYIVSIARSIDEAWGSIHSDQPNLILLETMMPHGTEGFHLVWRLRKHPDRQMSQTPIIIVSKIHQTTSLNLFPTHRDGHYRVCDFLPVQGFLDKPVDHNKLVITIADMFHEPISNLKNGSSLMAEDNIS